MNTTEPSPASDAAPPATPDKSPSPPTPPNRGEWMRANRWPLIAMLLALVLGFVVRTVFKEGYPGPGYDEALYRDFVVMVDRAGLWNFPIIAQRHIEGQRDPREQAKLPPTRFSYILTGWLVKRALHGDAPPGKLLPMKGRANDPALKSLALVSWLASFGIVIVAGVAAWRMFGPWEGACVAALAAVSPVIVHLGQAAFIDSYFAFWAMLCLWLLWENLQRPDRAGWLAALAGCLAVLVMTKENSFFVYMALCGVVALNRWLGFGTVTKKLLAAGIFGPALGMLILVTAAGGVGAFIETYELLVSKAQHLTYAIWSGDGPWYRYLLDILTASPIVLVLAISGIFTLPKEHKGYRYLLTFTVLSYAIMCNVRYGMNLRYSTLWLLPLSAFAAAQLLMLARRAGRHAALAGIGLFAVVCAYEIRQYHIFFVRNPIYELVPQGMLEAVNVIKDMEAIEAAEKLRQQQVLRGR